MKAKEPSVDFDKKKIPVEITKKIGKTPFLMSFIFI